MKKQDEINLLKCIIIQLERNNGMASIYNHMIGHKCKNGCNKDFEISNKRIHYIIQKLHNTNVTEYGVSPRIFWLNHGKTIDYIRIMIQDD